MTINDVSNVFGFLGGLGMFLYGMNIMADGMQKTAGSKMSQFLSMLTNNRLMAVCLGALITAIIQSSGVTTVMVVGFVSAGVLNLTQANEHKGIRDTPVERSAGYKPVRYGCDDKSDEYHDEICSHFA